MQVKTGISSLCASDKSTYVRKLKFLRLRHGTGGQKSKGFFFVPHPRPHQAKVRTFDNFGLNETCNKTKQNKIVICCERGSL